MKVVEGGLSWWAEPYERRWCQSLSFARPPLIPALSGFPNQELLRLAEPSPSLSPSLSPSPNPNPNQELLRLEEACAAAGLNTYLIRDAGHTEIEPGSRTVLAALPYNPNPSPNPNPNPYFNPNPNP